MYVFAAAEGMPISRLPFSPVYWEDLHWFLKKPLADALQAGMLSLLHGKQTPKLENKIFKLSSLFTCLDGGHKCGWRPGRVLEPGQAIPARLSKRPGADRPMSPAPHEAPQPPAALTLGSVGEGTRWVTSSQHHLSFPGLGN